MFTVLQDSSYVVDVVSVAKSLHLFMVFMCSGHVSSYISLSVSPLPLKKDMYLYFHSLCPFSLNSTADWQYGANEFVKQLPDDVIVHCMLCHTVQSVSKFNFLLHLILLPFLISMTMLVACFIWRQIFLAKYCVVLCRQIN